MRLSKGVTLRKLVLIEDRIVRVELETPALKVYRGFDLYPDDVLGKLMIECGKILIKNHKKVGDKK